MTDFEAFIKLKEMTRKLDRANERVAVLASALRWAEAAFVSARKAGLIGGCDRGGRLQRAAAREFRRNVKPIRDALRSLEST